MIVRLQEFLQPYFYVPGHFIGAEGRTVCRKEMEMKRLNEVLRQEKKYFLTVQDFSRLSEALENVMLRDEHNGAAGYRIRTLYFDTPYDEDYTDKVNGLEIRRKIRLRCYESERDFAILEMKQKQGNLQKKRALKIKCADAQRLTSGNYEALLGYEAPFAAECYGLMRMKCYRPKTVVEYRRKAFVAKENRTRVTFDRNITATETCYDIFSQNLPMYSVLEPFHAILEIKFDGFMLSYIKDLIQTADRLELAVSKYCLGRSASLRYIL